MGRRLQYEIDLDGSVRNVVVDRVGGSFAVTVDGRSWQVDAARVDAQTMSLIVSAMWPKGDNEAADPHDTPVLSGTHTPGSAGPGGASYEVSISPGAGTGQLVVRVGPTPFVVTLNGRERRKDSGGVDAGAGPQRVAAPMPGKVVRVLVKAGETVDARQPLVVVEAMKMQNELRASREGTVAEVHVKEGASVDAGALLIEIR